MSVANNKSSTKRGKTTKGLLGGITGKGFMPGVSGNPSGRPKGSLKSYVSSKLSEMTEEEKEEFLKGIDKDLIWRMAEGNPKQDTDVTSGGKELPQPLINLNVLRNDSPKEDSKTQEED